MKPTDLVPSLETSKKLAGAGWEKETYFKWHKRPDWKWHIVSDIVCGKLISYEPAPTLTELLEELPAEVDGVNVALWTGQKKYYHPEERWVTGYYIDYSRGLQGATNWSTNPAEAAALLYLSLKEQELI